MQRVLYLRLGALFCWRMQTNCSIDLEQPYLASFFSSAPVRPAAWSRTGYRPIRRAAFCCWRPEDPIATSGLKLPVGYYRSIYDERFSRLFVTEPSDTNSAGVH
jgi:hypothetical protein